MLDSLPVLILNPHSRCNCRCTMCDIWKTTKAQEISVADLKRQLESIKRLQVQWVVFSGGEALMHSDLWSLVDLLRERKIRITLLSSGLLLGRHAAALVKSVDDVIVSLDGPPEIHNSIRGVPGAFEITAAGIASIFERDPKFRVSARCTVQRSNFRHLRHTVEAAQGLRLTSLSFLAADVDSTAFARPNGWPMEKKSAVGLDSAGIAALESEIEALISRGECGRFICESPAKLRRIAGHFRAVLNEIPPVAPSCNAPWNSAVVEADGTVRPCFFHGSIGNLNSGKSLEQILNGPEAVAFRDSLERRYKLHLPKVCVFLELEIAVMSFAVRSGLLLTILCAGVFVAKAQDKQANRFVSNEVCKTCHPIIWSTFYKNPHFKSIASGKEPPESTGCQGCHGPGGKHVDNGGGAETIRAFTALPAEQVLDACLRCHSQTLSRANIRSSQHTLNGMACTSCHSIHSTQSAHALLRKPQTALCEGCHTDVRAQFAMPFKHRVEEGVISCTDCHNPHGSFAPTWRMASRPRHVEQAMGNEEPCLKCHADKRGPFIFEHLGVRVDGCETCHAPHGSPNSRLLRRPVVFTLCLECHNGAGNFGRLGTGIASQTPNHNMADPRYQNCTACHVRIHGSNASSTFLR